MASDFNKPAVTDGYAALLPALVTELQDIARGLEPTATGTHTNIPTNTIRWNQTSSKWERYNGTSWGSLPTTTDTYAISITGTAANIAGSGIVSVPNGGTGVATLTGLAYGNGTGAYSVATGAQIVAVIGITAVTNATNATYINSLDIGYRDIPPLVQTPGTALALADAGKMYVSSASGSWTIPANGSVAFPVGTVLTFVNNGFTNTINIGGTDTLRLAGSATTGTRTLAANGIATAVKITSTLWLISGAGLT